VSCHKATEYGPQGVGSISITHTSLFPCINIAVVEKHFCIKWNISFEMQLEVAAQARCLGVTTSVCPQDSTREPLMDFDEVWYLHYSIGGNPEIVIF
jgi:hypothetical protein